MPTPAIGKDLTWGDSFKKSFKSSKSSSSKSLKNSQPSTAHVQPKKVLASGKIAPEVTNTIPFEENQGVIKCGAYEGKNGVEINKWGTMVGSFGYEQLDIKDYEYRQCVHFFSAMKVDPRSDKILVTDASKAFCRLNVLRTEMEGVGLCRRINSVEGGPKEIAIGDFVNAAQYNKKHDGDLCRKLIRAINEEEINKVLGPDTSESTVPLSLAGGVCDSKPVIESKTSSFIQKSTSNIRRLVSRLSSKTLDQDAPLNAPTPVQVISKPSANHTSSNPATRKPRGAIKMRVLVKLLGLDKTKSDSTKKVPFESRAFGVKNVAMGNHHNHIDSDDDSSRRIGYSKGAVKKTNVLKVVNKRESKEEQISVRSKQEIEEYMKQFSDIEDQG